ncbi:MAG: hypothetical protein ACFFD2_05420 [Promethearchaeota archaeon]
MKSNITIGRPEVQAKELVPLENPPLIDPQMESKVFPKFQKLMKDYSEETHKNATRGIKITKKFRNWIEYNPSLNEFEKHKLLEYCNEYEKQLPKLKLEELQDIVEKLYPGSKITSTEYVNVRTKIGIQCVEGHIFEILPTSIKNGYWCQTCVIEKRKLKPEERQKALEELKEIVGLQHPGSKILSPEYVNAKTKVSVRCVEGHDFEMTPNSIKRGQWCRTCAIKKSKLKPEERQRRLEALKEIIEAQHPGSKITSTKYISAKIKIGIQCAKGHVFEIRPDHIKRGHWCRRCAVKERGFKNRLMSGKRQGQFDELKEFVEVHHPGSKILSPEYGNSETKLRIQCEKGHSFEIRPDCIKGGQWCQTCAIKKRTLKPEKRQRRLEELKEIVEKLHPGSKIKSTEYTNVNTKIGVQCAEGHAFEIRPDHIKRGQWCRTCAIKNRMLKPKKRQRKLEELKEIVEELHPGSKITSTKYINVNTKIGVQCAEGHAFEMTPDRIKRGQWCRRCAGTERLTLEELQEWVDLHRPCSKILSTEYINNKTKLRIQCAEGHTFEMTPNSVKKGQWCHDCSQGVSERVCRKLFETIFKKDFPKSRPEWLVNDRGNQMELDGYNKELRLAFEYQGGQHYKYVEYFHKSMKNFEQRQAADKVKREMCEKNGVTLIEIPYAVKYDQIQDYIIKKCKEENVNIPKFSKKINYKELDIYSTHSSRQLKKLRDIVEELHPVSKILSTEFVNTKTKIRIQCAKGHTFEITPNNIKKGLWCRRCAGTEKLTLEDLNEFVEMQHPGSKILSTEFVNTKTKIRIQCAEGHAFEITPNHIKRGHWCRRCAVKEVGLKNRLTFEERQRALEDLKDVVEMLHPGSKITSTEYVNVKTKVSVRCAEGHNFEIIPSGIKRGKWCRRCAGTERLTLKELQKWVDLHQPGSKITSTKYVNSKTKVSVQCAEGHAFEITPNHIKRGHWCRKCAVKEAGLKNRLMLEERRRALEDLKDIVEILHPGSKITSTEYINALTKVGIQCTKGHAFEIRPANIKSGYWCQTCAIEKRKLKPEERQARLEELREIVEELHPGSKITSTEYVNARTKVSVLCAEGHAFKSLPNSIKRGHWCSICVRNKRTRKRGKRKKEI